MLIISHRANINGPSPETENKPEQILICLKEGLDVEIDVWFINNKLYLGHDEPTYEIEENFLENEHLWCHAKNFDALNFMVKNEKIHFFWHQTDEYTITSKGYIWTFPTFYLDEKSICVLPEKDPNFRMPPKLHGICTDYPLRYRVI